MLTRGPHQASEKDHLHGPCQSGEVSSEGVERLTICPKSVEASSYLWFRVLKHEEPVAKFFQLTTK